MEKEEYFFNNFALNDLAIYNVGQCKCISDYSWGPGIRNHFVFVYIKHGKGNFSANRKTTHLTAGCMFIIKPNYKIFYAADHFDPWEYIWVSFNGTLAEYLFNGTKRQMIQVPYGNILSSQRNEFEKEMRLLVSAASKGTATSELQTVGCFMELLPRIVETVIPGISEKNSGSTFFRENSRTALYINSAIEFIHRNFSREISVSTIAKHIGLERSYFSNLFKATKGIPPGKFLLNYRMSKAKIMLLMDCMSVETVANSVGYRNTSSFSRAFTRVYGINPSLIRPITKKRTNGKELTLYYE